MWSDACAVAIRDLRMKLTSRQGRDDGHSASSRPRSSKGNGFDRSLSREQSAAVQSQPGNVISAIAKPASPSPLVNGQRQSIIRTSHPQNGQQDIQYRATSTAADNDFQIPRFVQHPLAQMATSSAIVIPNVSDTASAASMDTMRGPVTMHWMNLIPQNIDASFWSSGNLGTEDFGTLIPEVSETDIFYGFDIPFWMGDDQARNLGGNAWPDS